MSLLDVIMYLAAQSKRLTTVLFIIRLNKVGFFFLDGKDIQENSTVSISYFSRWFQIWKKGLVEG